MQMTLKDICTTLVESLRSQLSNASIKNIKEYTAITITISHQIERPILVDRINSILTTSGCNIFTPLRTQPNRIIAIKENEFADIEIRREQKDKKFVYNIYIYVSPTTIQYEWWYDRYMECI